jgi:hypothetical protein
MAKHNLIVLIFRKVYLVGTHCAIRTLQPAAYFIF